MNRLEERQKRRRASLSAFILTLLTGGLGLINWMVLGQTLRQLLPYSSISPWTWNLIDITAMMIFGLAWLYLVLISHHTFVKSFRRNKMRRSFCKWTGYQLCLLFLSQSAPYILGIHKWDGEYVLYAVSAGLAGIVLIVLSYRSPQASEQKS